MKLIKALLFLSFAIILPFSYEQYFCTAADAKYFDKLTNLIGSIHATNFDNLHEIAVFDLGMTEEQIAQLKNIEKLNVYKVDLVHPDLLKPVHSGWVSATEEKYVPGWYSWKPVVIKQALEMFPYVLWIDAGTTVLKPLDNLFKHIQANNYFLLTIGDETNNEHYLHPVAWQTTRRLVEKFNLNSTGMRWILNQEIITSCLIGASQESKKTFISEFAELAKDLKNFEDDGSTPNGFGTARHDQSVLTCLTYTKGLRALRQDHMQNSPIYLNFDKQEVPFYVTWNYKYVDNKTHIYNSRIDLRGYSDQIKFKNSGI